MKADYPSEAAYTRAAARLGCEVAAIKAVAMTEASDQGAFFDDDTPTKLFEAHVFSRLTNHAHDGARVPGVRFDWGVISRRKWAPGTYGPMSRQNVRLEAAAKLNREAALMACSWGLFQILGENYKRAGFGTLQTFINGMYDSVDAHLDAFVSFILADERLVRAIRRKEWSTFALYYNGEGYAVNRYHIRMAWNYKDAINAAA